MVSKMWSGIISKWNIFDMPKWALPVMVMGKEVMPNEMHMRK